MFKARIVWNNTATGADSRFDTMLPALTKEAIEQALNNQYDLDVEQVNETPLSDEERAEAEAFAEAAGIGITDEPEVNKIKITVDAVTFNADQTTAGFLATAVGDPYFSAYLMAGFVYTNFI